jgi:hypothetical protein
MCELKTQPMLLIDLKKDRIRVYKATLHQLGSPDYIQLLVNPVEQAIAICYSVRSDPLASRVDWQKLSDHTSFELYSKSLIRQLNAVCGDWMQDRSYRLVGEFIAGENIARFQLSEAKPLDPEAGGINV